MQVKPSLAERSVDVGKTRVTIRQATEGDAEMMIAHREDVFGEPNYFMWELDEFPPEPEGTRAWARSLAESPVGLCVLAVAHERGDDRVVGLADFRGQHQRRLRHRVEFGISIQAAYRGKGLGGTMLSAMSDWAGQHPDIEAIALGCFDENTRAIELYERLGFEREGVRRDMFFRDGRYHDEVLMSKRIKPRRVGERREG